MLIGLLPFTLLLIIRLTKALSLTDFQPINGFSSQCTQAYNTPLQGCTSSDFQSGHACSTTCITFLEALTKMLNTDCKGTSAFPNTLIGLFFSQQGTSTLCPNVLGSSSGDAGDQHSYSSAASPSGPSTSAESAPKSSATTSTTSMPVSSVSPSTSPSSSTVLSSSSLVSTGSSIASTTTVDAQTFIEPTDMATNMMSPTSSILSTASASKTSSAAGASNTGTEASTGGGGGTILELGSSGAAAPGLKGKPCLRMSIGIVGFLWWLL